MLIEIFSIFFIKPYSTRACQESSI